MTKWIQVLNCAVAIALAIGSFGEENCLGWASAALGWGCAAFYSLRIEAEAIQ